MQPIIKQGKGVSEAGGRQKKGRLSAGSTIMAQQTIKFCAYINILCPIKDCYKDVHA